MSCPDYLQSDFEYELQLQGLIEIEEKPLEKKRLIAALKLLLLTSPPEAPIVEEEEEEDDELEDIQEGDIRTV